MAMDYCGGPSPSTTTTAAAVQATSGSPSHVQCANSAFSACQSRAMDPAANPCGKYFSGGYRQCNGKQFITFYAGIVNDACRQSADVIQNDVVLPVPAAPVQASNTNRKLLQGQVIIKNPTTVGPKGIASSIQRIPVPAGAQVIVPGQPVVVPAGPQVIVSPPTPQQVIVPGQAQPVVVPGQPAGVVYPAQPLPVAPVAPVPVPVAPVVPGQPQVIYTVGQGRGH